MSSGFAAESTVVCAAAKNTKSLAAQTTCFGAGQTFTAGADCPWRGVMLRIVRLAMETITLSH